MPYRFGRRLRAARRLFLFLVLTATLYPLLLLGKALLSPWPRRRCQWRCWTVKAWSGGALRIFGVRCRVWGVPPSPPFLLVCNHLSYLDILVLGKSADGRFLAKDEVGRWPVIGRLAKSAGTLFVDRNNYRDLLRVHGIMGQAYGAGEGLVAFPEATSSAGREVLPFRPGLLETPAALGWPVHSASLSYATPGGEAPADTHVCWWGPMPFFGHLMHLLEIRRIDARLHFSPNGISDTDRKVLARRLQQEVSACFVPVVGADADS